MKRSDDRSESAVDVLRRKLAFLHKKLATADAAQEFSIREQINEARTQIKELGGDPDSSLRSDSLHELGVPRVSIGHLPQPGRYFVGRDDELSLLDAAWEDPSTNIVEFVAFGGVGKSALVAEWLKRLQRDGWRGAARVFGHSFYSQGSRDDAQASADSFLDQALRFFGDLDPTAGSPWDKGERLARLVREQPTLLILDGVEPLQFPGSHKDDAGQIRDPGLQALVRELAVGMNGLVVISTRARVQDIEGWERSSVRYHELHHLSVEAGSTLLRGIGVTGTDEQIAAAVHEVDSHALAVNLLGTFLCNARSGDVEDRHEIGLLEIGQTLEPVAGQQRNPDHTAKTFDRIMDRYELWLAGLEDREGTVDRRGHVALEIVRLTGLFDRPITAGEFAALLQGEPIDGLTDSAATASEDDVNLAVRNLVKYGLIAKVTDSPLKLDVPPWPDRECGVVVLDAHPLVREHFVRQFGRRKDKGGRTKEDDSSFTLPPSSFQEAHRRLYEHLKQSAPELPDNLNDMMPLYHAVTHGCKAGLWQEAFELLDVRIHRNAEYFSVRQLGAISLELSAMSHFFSSPWKSVIETFSRGQQGTLLNMTAYMLRSVGRSREATQPMQAAVDASIGIKSWDGASVSVANLSELSLSLGDVSSAVRQGEQCVELADRSGVEFHQVSKRTKLADALRCAEDSRLSLRESSAKSDASFAERKATLAFRAAEAIQQEWQPHYPRLYSSAGYRYCELFLDELEGSKKDERERLNKVHPSNDTSFHPASTLVASLQEVRNRAETTLKWTYENQSGILDFALNHLTLGRTWLAEAELRKSQSSIPKPQLDQAEHHLNESVSLLRQAGHQQHIPRGLLHRSALWRVNFQITNDESQIDLAERDLSEAELIAERGSMLIWRIEAALERTRLAICRAKVQKANDQSQIELAREKLAEAKRLVKQTEKPYEPHIPDWDEWDPPE